MKLTQTLLEWTLTSALLILVMTALRALLGKRVSAGLRYALWAVVLARLLVPVQLYISPIARMWAVTEIRAEKNVTDAPFAPAADDALSLPVSDAAPGNVHAFPDPLEPPSALDLTKLPGVLGWVWLGGSAVLALVLLASNLHFSRKLRRVRIPLESADCPLPAYIANGLPSPCLFGLARPAVYVTPDAAADSDMLRHVLAHEYTHYRHGDHVWNALRSIALVVHWWNPLVWLAVVLSHWDCELACDEGALHLLGDRARIAYGRTLLTLLADKPRAVGLLTCATTMTGGQKSVFDRVTRIARASKRRLWAAVAALLVTALACVCAFGSTEDEPDPAKTSGAGIDLRNIPADLSLSLDQQEEDAPFVRINGTVDGENLPRGALWYPTDSVLENTPYGELFMVNPDFTDSIEGLLTAGWLDEGHTSIILSTATQAMLSSYAPSGWWEFVVDVDRWTVTRMEAMDKSTLPAPVMMYPESITEEEAVRAARIAAKLLTEAEDYYNNSVTAPETESNP